MSIGFGVFWKPNPKGFWCLVWIGEYFKSIQPAACSSMRVFRRDRRKDIREHIHSNDQPQIEDMHKAAREGRETYGKARLVGFSRQIRWVEITSVPLPADDGTVQAVLSVVRDVTEQKRADRRQALQHAVAKVLAASSTVEHAVPDLLQAIVVSLDWHVGLFWRVQDDRQTISCMQDWSVDTTMVQEFVRSSQQEALTSGSDLPGDCWARGEPLWVEDVARGLMCTRRPLEATGRLHAPAHFRFGSGLTSMGSWSSTARRRRPRTGIY
ncbi:MAG: PAS domain-containing protein [Nitrospira sp.]|nr:PAS domain-containing protein [Nitrospira sp.]